METILPKVSLSYLSVYEFTGTFADNNLIGDNHEM